IFCKDDEACTVASGQARCEVVATCREDDQQCFGTSSLRTCVNGNWVTSTCPRGCLATPLGDFCGLDETTHLVSATLVYEVRGPNDALTGWGPLELANAQGFLALSARFLPDGRLIPVDATYTTQGATGGRFSLLVPSSPKSNDL